MPGEARLLLLLLLVAPARGDDAREALDLRASHPLCPAWAPYSQGACASCCAAAIATVVAARECLEHGRASRYSMAQLWDCASDGGCEKGGSLLGLLDTLGQDAAGAFVPADCAPLAPRSDSNQSQCRARLATCPPRHLTLETSLIFDLAHFAGPKPDVAFAMRALMHELQTQGPVIAVLRLVGRPNIEAFRTHKGAAVFAPPEDNNARNDPSQWIALQHCLVVYGWGVALEWDPTTATQRPVPFWRVQNSFGGGWGTNGTARILRGTGLLEAQWRSPRMAPHPCAPGESECGRLPYANYSLRAIDTTPQRAEAARPDNWAIIAFACGVVVVSTAVAGICLYRVTPSTRHDRSAYYYHPFLLD